MLFEVFRYTLESDSDVHDSLTDPIHYEHWDLIVNWYLSPFKVLVAFFGCWGMYQNFIMWFIGANKTAGSASMPVISNVTSLATPNGQPCQNNVGITTRSAALKVRDLGKKRERESETALLCTALVVHPTLWFSRSRCFSWSSTLSNLIFLPPTYSPALIYFGQERGWWITGNYHTVLKEKTETERVQPVLFVG
jgi:hypothetical protein